MATQKSFLDVFQSFINEEQGSEAVQGNITTWFIKNIKIIIKIYTSSTNSLSSRVILYFNILLSFQ